MKKEALFIYLMMIAFGIAGVYLMFFAGDISKYDGQTIAYEIDPNKKGSSNEEAYFPIYYYIVDGVDYKYESTSGSNSYPKENQNKIYYDTANPENCITEYERSTLKKAGIICFVVSGVFVVLILKKPSKYKDIDNTSEEVYELEEEKIVDDTENTNKRYNKRFILIARIILAPLIIILLFFTLIGGEFFKQTIESIDYIETTAMYYGEKTDYDSETLTKHIYTYYDKNGNKYEHIEYYPKESMPNIKLKIKYDENNPQKNYCENQIMKGGDFVLFIIEVVLLIVLIMLFFNKNILLRKHR